MVLVGQRSQEEVQMTRPMRGDAQKLDKQEVGVSSSQRLSLTSFQAAVCQTDIIARIAEITHGSVIGERQLRYIHVWVYIQL